MNEREKQKWYDLEVRKVEMLELIENSLAKLIIKFCKE